MRASGCTDLTAMGIESFFVCSLLILLGLEKSEKTENRTSLLADSDGNENRISYPTANGMQENRLGDTPGNNTVSRSNVNCVTKQ